MMDAAFGGFWQITKLPDHRHESINAALHLNPLLNASLKNTSGATLSYAIFWQDSIINLHPFLSSQTFKITKGLIEQNKEIKALKEKVEQLQQD